MLKRKVSAIWVLILAVITAAACIFATVIYIRYGRQAPNKALELGQFRFLKAESDSAGVSFEAINVREVGSDVVLDLRWVNNSGNPIAYGEAYELYRLKDGTWEKIDTKLDFPAICYCINSGSVGRISYTIPGHIDMTEGERYRLQTEFRFQYGDEYSEPLKNRLEFEMVKAMEYVPKEAYTYRSEHDFATLYLDPDNHTFSLSLSVLSSYWAHGRYTEKSGHIICKAADNTGNTYTFRREKDSLVFVAGRSSEIPQWSLSDRKAIGGVLDGAVFVAIPTKTNNCVPALKINVLTVSDGAREVETSLCLGTWTTTENNSNNTGASMQFCGPDIGKESGLPEITTAGSDRKANRLLLFFDTLPDNVTIKCMPKEGGNIRQIADIERDDRYYSFQLQEGSYIYRVIAEWNHGNRLEYGFIGNYSTSD